MTHTRITAVWSGATGLPGYSRFRFSGSMDGTEAAAAATRVRTFFDAIKAHLPTLVSINVEATAQIYSVASVLEGEVTFTAPAVVVGTGSGTYAAPAGSVVNWLTTTILAGRRVRGRTFLVPMVGSSFQADGSIAAAALTTINAAAAALVAGSPTLVVVTNNDPTFGESGVTGSSVPDRAAILRSRRD